MVKMRGSGGISANAVVCEVGNLVLDPQWNWEPIVGYESWGDVVVLLDPHQAGCTFLNVSKSFYCIRKSEAGTEFGDIPEVQEGCLAEVVYVLFERRRRLVTDVERYILARDGNVGDGGLTDLVLCVN